MAGISALLAQNQQSTAPPEQQGSASGGDMASLASLLQQGQGGPQPQGQPQQPISTQELTAAVRHLSEFSRRFQALLSEPDIGKKNMRPEVLEMMADIMGEGFVTLPQVMAQLKTLPDDPLGQRQWLQKHYDNNMQALQGLLAHYATTAPPVSAAEAMAGGPAKDHQGVINGMIGRLTGKKR